MGRGLVATLVAATVALGACGARDLMPDAGGGAGTGGGGAGGEGGFVCLSCPELGLLSDFEDIAAATIVHVGTRNGTWYAYNDASPTCVQVPSPLDPTTVYVGQPPPNGVHDLTLGALALHGMWSGCSAWGAGIGADINVPISTDGAIYVGPKRPYDLSAYVGVTFWAMAAPGSDPQLRLKLPMSGGTSIENGGTCTESATNKCGDDWGMRFTLPSSGAWKQITMRFTDAAFSQEGWGAVFPWNPTDVTSIQIQAVDHAVDTNLASYDFWIDDIYLIH